MPSGYDAVLDLSKYQWENVLKGRDHYAKVQPSIAKAYQQLKHTHPEEYEGLAAMSAKRQEQLLNDLMFNDDNSTVNKLQNAAKNLNRDVGLAAFSINTYPTFESDIGGFVVGNTQTGTDDNTRQINMRSPAFTQNFTPIPEDVKRNNQTLAHELTHYYGLERNGNKSLTGIPLKDIEATADAVAIKAIKNSSDRDNYPSKLLPLSVEGVDGTLNKADLSRIQ